MPRTCSRSVGDTPSNRRMLLSVVCVDEETDEVHQPFGAGVPTECFIQTEYGAVSYTHLDVYKRQILSYVYICIFNHFLLQFVS